MKHHFMGLIAQESGATDFRFQNPVFALATQILGSVRKLSDIFHQTGREMGVQIITNEMPSLDLWISGHQRFHMCQEIGFVMRWPICGSQDDTSDDISTHDERLGAMTLVLKLSALDASGVHWHAGTKPLQPLYTAQ